MEFFFYHAVQFGDIKKISVVRDGICFLYSIDISKYG